MNFKKLTAFLLTTAAVLTPVLVSCGGGEPGKTVTQTSGSGAQDTVTTAEDTQFEPDSLPADLNFNGKTMTVMYREEEVGEFWMAEQTGDIVDDTVYKSNRNVEDRLNVKLAVKTMIGNPNDLRIVFVNSVKNTVMAGDDAFQAVAMLTYNMPQFIQDGVVLNLFDIPHLDFDKPWWVKDLTEYGTIGGKLYIASGDISLSLIKKTLCVYYNIDLANSLKVESPYDKVHSGTWTKEVMEAMAKGAYSDLNGDGTATTDDRYGYAIYDSNHLNMYIGCFDLEVTSQNADGYPVAAFGSEKVVSAVSYLCKLFWENDGIFFNKLSDAGTDLTVHEALRNMFTSGRLLFVSAEFWNADNYRDMQNEYGVLPAPKWDEKQEGYYTVARNVYSSFSVPVTCGDKELTGAVLEAIASENFRTLSPVYFETALKVKYSRDLEAAQMYDIIKTGMKFNFGYTYHLVVGLTDNLRSAVSDNKPDWASAYAAKGTAAQAKIDKFIETVLAQK